MALAGIRDMSTIEEPPQDRLPVQTFVMEHDWGVLADAMRRELNRGGQVYYLHNRVDNIERTAMRIAEMLDGASVAVAHGKMDEEQLSRVMEDMVEGRVQVLVCTTIIETGIDIPNVNTLIIEDADKLGLAQLHQIRGRVAAPPAGPAPISPSSATSRSPRSRKSGWRPYGNSRSSTPASASPCATLRYAARATCSARSSPATSSTSATTCT